MRFEVVTIFPELIETAAACGLIGKAIERGTLELRARSPREFTHDNHRSVDDAPYGGGSGMVMLLEPLIATIEALDADAAKAGLPRATRIVLSPHGARFDQAAAGRLAAQAAVMLICGRYEGIDARVSCFADEELSLGDFVLNGGEVAALAVIEAVGRLVPGVLGNQHSLAVESHACGLLEHPQYTRPREFRGHCVPDALLSGNHGEIAAFRRREALRLTHERRPDLLQNADLSDEDRRFLAGLP
ncbi:MAG: tRNA (guanosine(37)-N1)-methyltransferase TrmD [Myxococcales bacterium]|nr:tRNA (guanosine(37)-N1)-methyltransferase TrmD [Myxococcales bacterium]